MSRRRKAEHIDLAVDSAGRRYTTHVLATDQDPWRGAIILSPWVVQDLRQRGLLPLHEVALDGGSERTEATP